MGVGWKARRVLGRGEAEMVRRGRCEDPAGCCGKSARVGRVMTVQGTILWLGGRMVGRLGPFKASLPEIGDQGVVPW